MSEMTISTINLINRKKQQVWTNEKIFTLRELGTGDRLDISQATRKLAKMHVEMTDLRDKN